MKRKQIILSLSFLAYITTFPIMLMVKKDVSFSELENRYLEQKPKFDMEDFLDGKFGENLEKYVADQFPLRDEFISIKSNFERMTNKKDSNGVYIGKNGYFFDNIKVKDAELPNKIINKLNDFSSKYNTFIMIAPTSIEILEDYLPKYAHKLNQTEFIKNLYDSLNENIKTINIVDTLKSHKDEYIYYKTDHHWTPLGAFYAYQEFLKHSGFDNKDISLFTEQTLTDSFYGTLFSKGNFSYASPDSIKMLMPKTDLNYTVKYELDNKTENTIYHKDALNKKDKYEVFFGGNHPLIKITNNDAKNENKIVIVKDSYANTFIPFLLEDYKEIHIIDVRMYNYKISSYLDETNIKDVLFLYNIDSILSDVNLLKIK